MMRDGLVGRTTNAGAHPRGGGGPGWNLSSARFSWFLPLNYVIWIVAAWVRMLFAMWEDRASLQHGDRLTLGEYFAPYWPVAIIQENFCSGPPLEKILGAPLDRRQTCDRHPDLHITNGRPASRRRPTCSLPTSDRRQ